MAKSGNNQKPAADDGGSEQGGPSLSRRSCLSLAAGAVASAAGYAGVTSSVAAETVDGGGVVYGYGGVPIETSPTLQSETEPNDGPETANNILLNAPVTGQVEADDDDWFAVEISADEQVDIEYTQSIDRGFSAVVFYSPDGDFLEHTYVGASEPVTLSATTNDAGVYFVQIAHMMGSGIDYEFSVTTPSEDYSPQNYGEYGYGGVKV